MALRLTRSAAELGGVSSPAEERHVRRRREGEAGASDAGGEQEPALGAPAPPALNDMPDTVKRAELVGVTYAVLDRALDASPALRASPYANEACLRALNALGGDEAALLAEARLLAFAVVDAPADTSRQVGEGEAFAVAYGLSLAPTRPLRAPCSVCGADDGLLFWSCSHATCNACTAFSAGAYSDTRPAPQLGPGARLPPVATLPCPQLGGCRGFLPRALHALHLPDAARAALAEATQFEAAAAAARGWRACGGAGCGRFVAVTAAEQSCRCPCGARTCLQGGSEATNCGGGAHEGLSCAAARDVEAVAAAWAPAMEAEAEEGEDAPAARAPPPRAPPPTSPREELGWVRSLAAVAAEPLAAAQLPAAACEASFEELSAAAEAVLALLPSREARLAEGRAAAVAHARRCAGQAAERAAACAAGAGADAATAAEEAAEAARWARHGASAAAALGCEAAALAEAEAAAASAEASAAGARARKAAAGTADPEALSADWLLSHSRPCPTPGCGRLLTKTEGSCNAMEPCPSCQRACCWSCLGPVHNHSTGPCDRSRDRAAVEAALRAAGRGAEEAQAQARAMAAADAAPRAQRPRSEPQRALAFADAALARALLPTTAEAAMAPLRLALAAARLQGPGGDAALLLAALMRVLEHDRAEGRRRLQARLAEPRPAVRAERARARRAAPRGLARYGNGQSEAARAADVAAFAAALRAVDALRAGAGGGGGREASASLLAAAHSCARRAAEHERRRAAAAAGETARSAALAAAHAALRRAAEDDRLLRLALFSREVVAEGAPPLSEAAAEALLARAESLGARADALAALAQRALAAEAGREDEAALLREAAALTVASDELARLGPTSLLALCGGAAEVARRAQQAAGGGGGLPEAAAPEPSTTQPMDE